MFFKCIGEKYYTMVSGLIRFLLTLHIISILNYMVRNKINWRVPKGAELTELDKKVLYFQNKGHLVPSRKLIKTPEQIEGIRRSGVINTAVLDLVASEIKAGMSTAEIDKMVYDFTVSHGAIPAPLNYEGFPKSVCTSINEVVCHGIPSEDEILEEGDIINVDVTTIVDGYYADASRMYCIGQVSPEAKRLVDVTKECLELSLEAVRPGVSGAFRPPSARLENPVSTRPGQTFST